jgi:leader peptidase (prepilin peptidase)/N-methyltransferase
MMTLILSFIFGAIVGIFLNVCIHRLPAHQSVVAPSSHCPFCKQPIAFYDNIPILSFILLRGRCRQCKASISYQYPLVECLTGFLSLILMRQYGLSLNYAVYFMFGASLVVVTFIDLKHQIIPDSISLPGIAFGLLSSLFLPNLTFLDSLIGTAAGGGSLLLVAGGYYLLTKKEGMGLGDVKLLAMMGAFLGWTSILFIILVGSLSGALVGIAVMLIKKKDRKYAIPFGPFLSLGALCYLLYGQEMIRWYVHFHLWINNRIGFLS